VPRNRRHARTSACRGVRVETVPAPTVRYEFHSSSDRVLVRSQGADLGAYYELETNRPLCNGDGHIVYSFEAVDQERRTGAPGLQKTPVMLHLYEGGRRVRGQRSDCPVIFIYTWSMICTYPVL
jgi:hypothetical protein